MTASSSVSRDETLQLMLDEIEKQTNSTIGFYHFLDVDQETLLLQAWSTNTLRNMCNAEGKGSHYNISQAGVWVDCVRKQGPVIHNDYASLANRKGLPPGHAAVKREMVVPILRNGRIVAIIGVGNKLTDYNATDVEIAQFLGQLSWEIFERIQAVDELQTAHAEVERNVRELERAYKDMESFSYVASHDLKAPLITIEGFSNILLEDYAEMLDDKGRDFLMRINNNTKRMKQLIADLLAFSRISTKEVRKAEFNMEALAQKLINELNPTVGERDIKFEVKQLPSAYGDLPMIKQVFLNFLSNAIKFTQTRDNAMIEVGGYSENNENVYYVRDNGMGFDMQFSDRLFGLFQRIHSSQEVEGTGIGLVIVKNIIEKHGGRVWAEGKPDEGAIFYFTLPVKQE
jgi:signal transduction histidine kinase